MENKNLNFHSKGSETKLRLEDVQRGLCDLGDSLEEKEDLFFKIIEFFPYPIQVLSSNGTSVMINTAFLMEFEIQSKDQVEGIYNIFLDPYIVENGYLESVKNVFKGQTEFLRDLKVPFQDIINRYELKIYNTYTMYHDLTAFPIINSQEKVSFVVIIFMNRRIYRAKKSIIQAIEYMTTNWQNEFKISEVAKAANLSPYYFSRLFKNNIGITPYNYYLNLKINHLKEKLCDINLSISEAFTACGVDYHGHFAKMFKKNVGVTPSKYRETNNHK